MMIKTIPGLKAVVLGLLAASGACAALCAGGGELGAATAWAAQTWTGLPQPSPVDAKTLADAKPPAEAQTIVEDRPAAPVRSPGGPKAGAPRKLVVDGMPGMRSRTVRMRVTAYCPCAICCGRRTGLTASGLGVGTNGSKFAATGEAHVAPMGALVCVAGYNGGRPVPVIDRMAAGDGPRLDVFFWSHERAQEWGVRWMDVTVYTPVR